jgi:uncharacterized protein YndB with AHSA1/START domain
METPNYQHSVKIAAAPQDVFTAITQRIPEWWSEAFEGASKELNDVFIVRFGPSFFQMRIANLMKDQKVEWYCMDTHQQAPPGTRPVDNPKEWVGTSVIWDITGQGTETTLNLIHEGLTPAFECWAICEQGWNQTINSLQQLLDKGKGLPFACLSGEFLEQARVQQAMEQQENA